ncbi:hypothetical protein [Brevibacterium casei]|uniref:hypothetical protein n=1 Tax=Brevibacterium casei TaxID=33889 RepID=UPI0013DEAB52|nr:hypothetical protein [Brevibacterium casei]
MVVDAVSALRELDFEIVAGGNRGSWRVRGPEGIWFEVSPAPAVPHLDAHTVRSYTAHHGWSGGVLFVAESATEGIIERAESGELDILTTAPIRLIHSGITYSVHTAATTDHRSETPKRARPAWTRWALIRYLLLNDAPARQSSIADVLGVSQQAVSSALKMLGPFVDDAGDGVYAMDRQGLLRLWIDEYLGPGGQEFGWFSLDPIVQQVAQAREIFHFLDQTILVGGDVAADVIAPWKLPTTGRIYTDAPIDLSEGGFVPAPLDEATLIITVPRDPTILRLGSVRPSRSETGGLPVADPLIVMWDLLHSGSVDSGPAADKIAEVVVERQR